MASVNVFTPHSPLKFYLTWSNQLSLPISRYIERLEHLRNSIGLDSFKFDAGESSFAPQVPKLSCPEHEHPRCLTKAYVEAASRMGPMIEFRTGAQTQYLPNYIRIIDSWGDVRGEIFGRKKGEWLYFCFKFSQQPHKSRRVCIKHTCLVLKMARMYLNELQSSTKVYSYLATNPFYRILIVLYLISIHSL